MNEPEKVVLELSRNEALVLSAFLSRFSKEDKLIIEDAAESRVLWDLCCDLESALYEHLREDYAEILQKARDAVRDVES